MANKKEQQRSYMQSYVPRGNGKRYSSSQALLYGLDRRGGADSKSMSECVNIDVARLPEIWSVKVPSKKKSLESDFGDIVGVFGYGNYIYIACEKDKKLTLNRIGGETIVSTSWDVEEDNVGKSREMAVFCVYSPNENQMYYNATPEYDLLIYPDKKYIDIKDFSKANDILNSLGKDVSPKFEHITIWNGRVFGTKGNLVVCSEASKFAEYDLDTPEGETDKDGLTTGGYDASHAWYTTTQANTQSSGNITAITAYDGHPIVFKDDYMHQINNNKNPFRIADIVAIGCVSARSVCELDSILYFASRDGIYRYSGGYPKKISEQLNFEEFGSDVVCAGFNGVLYVYCEGLDESLIFTYSPSSGLWSAIDNPHGSGKIVSFCVNDNGIYSVGKNGVVYLYPDNDGENGTYSAWHFKTDCILSGASEDKRLHSLSVVASGDNLEATISGDSRFKDDKILAVVISKKELYGIDKMRALIRNTDRLYHTMRFEGSGMIHIYRIDTTYSYSGRRYD